MVVLNPVTIVPREVWGALPPHSPSEPIQHPVPNIVMSFDSDTNRDTDPEKCMESMRSLQKLHMDKFGYPDIGYNFVIGGDLRVYEGKGWNQRPSNQPRTRDCEDLTLNIGNMGTLDREDLPFEMYKSYLELMKEAMLKKYIVDEYDVIDEPETPEVEEEEGKSDEALIIKDARFKPFDVDKVVKQYGDQIRPLLDSDYDDSGSDVSFADLNCDVSEVNDDDSDDDEVYSGDEDDSDGSEDDNDGSEDDNDGNNDDYDGSKDVYDGSNDNVDAVKDKPDSVDGDSDDSQETTYSNETDSYASDDYSYSSYYGDSDDSKNGSGASKSSYSQGSDSDKKIENVQIKETFQKVESEKDSDEYDLETLDYDSLFE